MNESPETNPPITQVDEIDFRELFGVFWDGKLLMAGIVFISMVIAAAIALYLPNTYRAEALLAPKEQGEIGGFSTLASQYSGLASLAGIEIGSGSERSTAMGLEILKSRRFITNFIKRRDLLVSLIAADNWDPLTNELEIDSDDYDVLTRTWVRKVRPPKQQTPSLQEAYEKFEEILTVEQNKSNGFVTISIEHYSPLIAKQWVDWLVDDLNESTMLEDVAEANEAIEYLDDQINKTSLAELRGIFFGLIEEQMKTIILANVADEYFLKTLDPAIAPEEKSGPNRVLILFLGIVLGFIVACSVVLLRGRNTERS